LLPLRPLIPQVLGVVTRRKIAVVPAMRTGNGGQVTSESKTRTPRTAFYTREMHPYQAELALPLIRRIETIGKKVARLASIYAESFRDSPVAMFLPPGCDLSSLMRFPIAFPGKDRSRILERAQRQGIYLKVMWAEGAGLEGLPNSAWAARNLVLLPLYTALSECSAARLAEEVLEIDRGTPVKPSGMPEP
jgi:dTDP-4-amino-4,6-dideoxygalactose transaminase